MPWKIGIVWVIICLGFVDKVSAQTETDIRTYIARYKELAKSEQIRTGVPAAIKLAQGIHESTAGTSDLASRSNNHFGIKCKSTWRGDTVLHDDDARQECFRKYPDVAKSYMDHSDFLRASQRYAPLFALDVNDYLGWASGLKKAGYATNPAYVRKITDLIERFELQQYTLEAQKKTRVDSTNVANANVGISATNDNAPVQEVVPVLYKGLKGFWASKGQSLVDKAVLYGVKYNKLLALNDLPDAPLSSNMFIFIEPKRAIGQSEFHTVREGESLQVISQKEAMRLDSLMAYNNLRSGQEVLPGEKVVLLPGKISFPRTRDNQVTANAPVGSGVQSDNTPPETKAKTNPVVVNNESGVPPHLLANASTGKVDTSLKSNTTNPVIVNNSAPGSREAQSPGVANSGQTRVIRDTITKVQRGNGPQTVIVRKEGSTLKSDGPVNLTPKPLPKKDTLVLNNGSIDTQQVLVAIPEPSNSDILDVEKARRTEALLNSNPLPISKATSNTSALTNQSSAVKTTKTTSTSIIIKKADSVKSPTYGVNEKKELAKATPEAELPAHLKPEPPKPTTAPVRMRPAEVIIPTTNYDEPGVSDTVKNLRRKFDLIVNTPLPERPYKDSPPMLVPKPVASETTAVSSPKLTGNKPTAANNTKKPAAKTGTAKGGKAPAKTGAGKGKTGAKSGSGKAPVKKKK